MPKIFGNRRIPTNTIIGVSSEELTQQEMSKPQGILTYSPDSWRHVSSVHVATPHKVRIIAESKCKTDRYDSRMLAELLRVNFLPESYVVPKHIRALREVLRQRMRLVKARTMFKNRIRHLLFLSGLSLKATDVSSLKAHRELKNRNVKTIKVLTYSTPRNDTTNIVPSVPQNRRLARDLRITRNTIFIFS